MALHLEKLLFLCILVAMAPIICSCGLSATPEVQQYKFYHNSDWNKEQRIAGEKIAFMYHDEFATHIGTTDEGGYRAVYFTINPALSEFELKDSEITPLKMYQYYSCFCQQCEDTLPIHIGSISGQKLNNNRWHIQLDAIQTSTYGVYVDTCHRTTIEHDFELDN